MHLEYREGLFYMGRLSINGIYIEKKRRCLVVSSKLPQILIDPTYEGHMISGYATLLSSNVVLADLPWQERINCPLENASAEMANVLEGLLSAASPLVA